jgi:hypothetical protein
LTATGLIAGLYYLHVLGGGNTNNYSLGIDPAATSSTRVLYVNDNSLANDYYATAIGSASNSGLTPSAPKATIQQVLDSYTLGPNDLVPMDTGVYSSAVLATADDEGAVYAGSPGVSRLNATFEMADSDFNTLYRLTFGGSGTSIDIHGTSVDPTTNTSLRQLRILSSSTGIRLNGGADHLVADTVIEGSGSYGIDISNAANVSLLRNTISGRSYGIYSSSITSMLVDSNNVSASSFALYSSGSLTINNDDGDGKSTLQQ